MVEEKQQILFTPLTAGLGFRNETEVHPAPRISKKKTKEIVYQFSHLADLVEPENQKINFLCYLELLYSCLLDHFFSFGIFCFYLGCLSFITESALNLLFVSNYLIPIALFYLFHFVSLSFLSRFFFNQSLGDWLLRSTHHLSHSSDWKKKMHLAKLSLLNALFIPYLPRKT